WGAAGPEGKVSARPTSAVGSAAAATIGQSFACAIRISIIDPPVGVLPRYLLSIQRAWQAVTLRGAVRRPRPSRDAKTQYRWLMGSSSAGNSVITRQPLSVTTTSSSMRAAEYPSPAGQ